MAKYHTNNLLGGTQQNMTTTFKTLVSVVSSATVQRVKIYELNLGSDATPGDTVVYWDVSRQTAAGTSTSVTPVPIDPADAACRAASTANSTAEPTITASSSVFTLAANQRASYRWVAAPGGELVGPATSAAGFALRGRGATAGFASTLVGSIYFEE